MTRQSRLGHPQSVLMQRTQLLLREATMSYLEIYKATNISPHWLSLFVNNDVPDPSVNRVEALYNFLMDKTLESQLKTLAYHDSMCHLIVANERAAAADKN